MSTTSRYLCISLGSNKFAIPLSQIREVIGKMEYTPIPLAPSYFEGAINLRGQIISIIDLRKRLNIEGQSLQTPATTIILDLAPLSLGIIVDSVDQVITVDPENVNKAPDIESSVDAKFLEGVFMQNERLTLVLDIKSALNTKDYQILEQQKVS